MEILKAVHLKKHYGSGENLVRAVDDVSFSIEKGSFTAIVGTSGSGKTTLLNLIGGLDYADSGETIIDGQSIMKMTQEQLTVFRRRNIGFVFQNYNLISVQNIYKNIVLPIRLDGRRPDRDYIEHICRQLGIEGKMDRYPNQLSGGQQQRVSIASLRLPDTSTTIGKRDAALLSLMYASGTRAQEICDLRVRDALFDRDNTTLTITGKGNKTRRIRIAQPCAEMLRNYLVWRGIDQQLDNHIFSTRTHEHMTISCVEAIYKKYLYAAKQQNPDMFRQGKYSPHSMRHTTAMHMLEAGVPMMAIKNFLGHASVITTERYAELSQSTVDKHIKAWNQRWFPDTTATKENIRPTAQTGGIPDFLR